MVGVLSEGPDMQGWAATGQVDPHTHPPGLTSVQRGQNWVPSRGPSDALSTTSLFFQAMSLGQPLGWGGQAEPTFQGQGRSEEPLIARALLTGQLALMSSQ